MNRFVFYATSGLFCLFFIFCVQPAIAQQAPEEAPGIGGEMTLADCIRVAMKENKTIKSAYLDRVVQKYSLSVAEDKFTPKMTLSTGANYAETSIRDSDTIGATVTDVSATVSELLPSGAALELTANQGTVNGDTTSGTDVNYGWNVSLTQPLLKGGGFDVTSASVRSARLSELNNVLSLKTTLIDTLTTVITTYRDYVRALKELDISRQSFERGKELVEINKELIAAGRMAKIDIVQSEADVANREYSLLSSENGADAARLALVKAMGIDRKAQITPIGTFDIEPIPYELTQAKSIAFENRPDYRSALLNMEDSQISLMLSKNDQLWDLSLTGDYGQNFIRPGGLGVNSDTDAWAVGLNLSIPIGDMTIYQSYLNAKTSQQQLDLSLTKLKDDIEIEVEDVLRDADMKMRQVKLAQLARELSEKKVEIETEKLKMGRSTNFQLVSFQNDLVNAQNNELNSIISYLNALTDIERTLGITLDRWGVALVERQGE
ncbi:MAG: TolC family protein [Desulfuromonadales bacterium]|nr:TolC family protein [Desulfuromonadales bacterium]